MDSDRLLRGLCGDCFRPKRNQCIQKVNTIFTWEIKEDFEKTQYFYEIWEFWKISRKSFCPKKISLKNEIMKNSEDNSKDFEWKA